MAINKYYIGILIFVILTSSVYILLPDKVRIDIQKTKTLISVLEDDKWVLGATEFLNLFDGTKKMRAKSRVITNKTEGNLITITRTAKWKDNITTIHDYVFNPTIPDVELVPIEETLTCINCEGKIVHFEYRNILYTGITREAISAESFGHNIKVEWQEGYDWAKVYQQKIASDKLIIRYKPQSDYEVYSVRLFDPKRLPTEITEDILISPGIFEIRKCDIRYFKESIFETIVLFRDAISCLNHTGSNTTCSTVKEPYDNIRKIEEITKSNKINCRNIGIRIRGENHVCPEDYRCNVELNKWCVVNLNDGDKSLNYLQANGKGWDGFCIPIPELKEGLKVSSYKNIFIEVK